MKNIVINENKKEKLIVLDGNSLIHRAFHALPLFTTAKGEFTNGVYGFTRMLLKIIREEKPNYLAVAFDIGKVTFRHAKFQEYKGTRKATPNELKPQFIIVKDLLQAMKIPFFQLEGYEADDLIGTIVKQGEQKGYMNYIVTGDKDTLQLISPTTKVKLTRKGISEIEEFDLAVLQEKYQLTPQQFIDLKGLMGDSSDNIPGVPGVGEKTGLKLMHQYGSIENIYAAIEEIKGAKLKERLADNHDQALLSRELATIVCDAPISVDDVNAFSQDNWDTQQLLELFSRLEFKSLYAELVSDAGEEIESAANIQFNNSVTYITDDETLNQLYQEAIAKNQLYFAVNLEQFAIAFQVEKTVYFWEDNGSYPIENLKNLFVHKEIKKHTHNCKEKYVALHELGIAIDNIAGDIMLQVYLLNPNNTGENLNELAVEYLGKQWSEDEDPVVKLGEKVQLIKMLSEQLTGRLEEINIAQLYSQVELPLAITLAKMELEGIQLNIEELTKMNEQLVISISELEKEIFQLADEEFNINSPKQLGVILFEKLQLPPLKKTKTGYSTNAEVLEALADKHDIVKKILDYRQLVKLKTTYVDGLQKLLDPATHRIHTTFNQTITATGRLSSTEPNLQNIPIRLELGRKIRKAFIPQAQDRVLLAADYSQIELRVLAHISKDEKLIEAFEKGEDIHTKTACQVFGVVPEEVTSEMRRRAKAVNFGIIYGISDFGLSRDLGIQRGEAKRYIDSYLANYPGVKQYLEDIVQTAKNNGYVTTILNRRRYLPDLHSSNKNIQNFGQRTAMNTPIQGSAADIIKVAMLNVDKAIEQHKLDCKILLQVHDELIFDVTKADLSEAVQLIKQVMETVLPLTVPLQVDVKWGYNWYEMEPMG